MLTSISIAKVRAAQRSRRRKKVAITTVDTCRPTNYWQGMIPDTLEALSLKGGLIENGFENIEATSFIVAQPTEQGTFEDFSMFGTTTETVGETPDLAPLEPELRERVAFDESTKELTVTGILTESDQAALEKCFPSATDRHAIERLRVRSQGQKPATAVVAAKEPIRVPALSIRIDGQLELFDDSHFLLAPWDLAKCDAILTEKELPSTWSGGRLGEIDVTQAGKVELTHFVNGLHEQMNLITGESGWEVANLTQWLDRNIRHPDIPQVQSSLFIYRLVSELIERRGVTVEQLARLKFSFRQPIGGKKNRLP